jgi:hypothetical protein
VNPYREFGESAVLTGANCLISRGLKAPIRQEIGAQIKRFRLTGLPLDHVNGYRNFHLHPSVFDAIRRDYHKRGIARVRLPRDPLLTNLRLAWGRYFYRLSQAMVLSQLRLARWAPWSGAESGIPVWSPAPCNGVAWTKI